MLTLLDLFSSFGRIVSTLFRPLVLGTNNLGALQGIFSRASMFWIRMVPDPCGSCRRCQKVCKAGCIDLEKQTADVSRCVACSEQCLTKAVAPQTDTGKGFPF